MPREFRYKGYTLEELKKMSIDEFTKIVSSRERRSLKRGFTEQQKRLLENIRKEPEKFHKTHVRDMIILPQMIGAKLGIYKGGGKAGDATGKWVSLTITPEMLGKRIGEFSIPISRVKHSAPGIGASRRLETYSGERLNPLCNENEQNSLYLPNKALFGSLF